jgi:hypothetical protein
MCMTRCSSWWSPTGSGNAKRASDIPQQQHIPVGGHAPFSGYHVL